MKHLLIAEDDDGLRSLMASWFQRIPNLEVMVFADGVGALAAIREHKIDIVISDLNMPNLNGADLLRAVGSIEGHRPRFYILSGMGAHDADNLEELGAYGVYEKSQVLHLLRMIKESILSAA